MNKCDLGKSFSAQHCLIRPIEKLKLCLDQVLVFNVLQTDLSKAFDWLRMD